jgi:hypothetical protein
MTASLRDHARAIRYRQLALREADRSKAALLNLIADEAERGVLVTSDRSGFQRSEPQPPYQQFQYRTGPLPGPLA